jgi:hypothetical protein
MRSPRPIAPYKREAGEGLLDAGIVDVPVEGGVYRVIPQSDWRDL